MVQASDPVNGSAQSFDAERAVRKHIGDYALFVAGMYPEAMASNPGFAAAIQALANLSWRARRVTTSSASSTCSSMSRKRRCLRGSRTASSATFSGLSLVREEIGPRKPLMLPPMVN